MKKLFRCLVKLSRANRRRPPLFSDLAIATGLMVKRVFSVSFRDLSRFMNSALNLLNCHCHALTIYTFNKGTIQCLTIDFTGLKVYGNDERLVWREFI